MEKQEPIAAVGDRAGHEETHGPAVRAMFDRIAPTYDLLNRVLSAGVDVRWRAQAIATLARAPAGEVLDLCAGTLDLSAAIERAHTARPIVAVDFAADMLARGRSKVARTEILVGDALDLPLRSERFAAVICAFGLRNLSDPERGVAEAVRVLAPGGLLVILEFFRPEPGLRGAITRGFHAAYGQVVLPLAGRAISGDGDAYAYLARSMASFLTRRELERLLERRGLLGIEGRDLTLGVASLVVARKPRAA